MTTPGARIKGRQLEHRPEAVSAALASRAVEIAGGIEGQATRDCLPRPWASPTKVIMRRSPWNRYKMCAIRSQNGISFKRASRGHWRAGTGVPTMAGERASP
jgi:hypothetical protein